MHKILEHLYYVFSNYLGTWNSFRHKQLLMFITLKHNHYKADFYLQPLGPIISETDSIPSLYMFYEEFSLLSRTWFIFMFCHHITVMVSEFCCHLLTKNGPKSFVTNVHILAHMYTCFHKTILSGNVTRFMYMPIYSFRYPFRRHIPVEPPTF